MIKPTELINWLQEQEEEAYERYKTERGASPAEQRALGAYYAYQAVKEYVSEGDDG